MLWEWDGILYELRSITLAPEFVATHKIQKLVIMISRKSGQLYSKMSQRTRLENILRE